MSVVEKFAVKGPKNQSVMDQPNISLSYAERVLKRKKLTVSNTDFVNTCK